MGTPEHQRHAKHGSALLGITQSGGEASPALHARLLRTRADVVAIADAWDALTIALSASPFVGATFYLAWLEERGAGHEPLAVAIESSDGALVAVCPWVRRGSLALSVAGRFRIAGELLVPEELTVAAWRLGLETVLSERAVRALLVPWLTDDATQLPAAEAACRALGLRHRAFPRYRRWFQPIEGTFDEYLAGWSRNRRRSLRKSRNKLEREGDVVFRDVTAEEGWPVLRELYERQWDPGERVDAVWLDSEAGERVNRAVLARYPHAITLLEVGGTPVAAAVTISSGSYRVFLYLVRDPRLAAASPGETLNAEVVRRAFDDGGVRVLDHMGEGGRKDRQFLAPTQAYELVVAAPGALGRLALGARATQLALRERIAARRRPAAAPVADDA